MIDVRVGRQTSGHGITLFPIARLLSAKTGQTGARSPAQGLVLVGLVVQQGVELFGPLLQQGIGLV